KTSEEVKATKDKASEKIRSSDKGKAADVVITEEIPEFDTLKMGKGKESVVKKKARTSKRKPARRLAIADEEDSEATIE
ncbi:hypothetical protein A2U01_0095415, partial [Trifolium medium]|nr:hypothetical protein [Trifolium medium]